MVFSSVIFLAWFLPVFLLVGVLAYTFQIYFDFSGYSNMAIGLGNIQGRFIRADYLFF